MPNTTTCVCLTSTTQSHALQTLSTSASLTYNGSDATNVQTVENDHLLHTMIISLGIVGPPRNHESEPHPIMLTTQDWLHQWIDEQHDREDMKRWTEQ